MEPASVYKERAVQITRDQIDVPVVSFPPRGMWLSQAYPSSPDPRRPLSPVSCHPAHPRLWWISPRPTVAFAESRRAKEARVSVKKNFYSDNVSGAAPEILEAIITANAGDTAPYGGDPWSERLQERFAELFETEAEVYPVGTGTAANGLCASVLTAPYGAIYVSDAAHVHSSECGGAEFWSGGNARTVPLPTVNGKAAAPDLARAVEESGARSADVPPRAISLTQATE